MRNARQPYRVLLGATLLFMSINAQADFMTQDIELSYRFPTTESVPTNNQFVTQFTVGSGDEGISGFAFDPQINVDVSDTNIELVFEIDTNFGGTVDIFNGWRFNDLGDTIEAIVGVTLGSNTNLNVLRGDFDPDVDITFDPDSVFVNMDGLFVFAGSVLSLDVSFDQATSAAEPGTLMLLGLGILGLTWRRRRDNIA